MCASFSFTILYIFFIACKKTNNKIVKNVYNGGLISKRNLFQPTNGSGWEPIYGVETINAILIIKKQNIKKFINIKHSMYRKLIILYIQIYIHIYTNI